MRYHNTVIVFVFVGSVVLLVPINDGQIKVVIIMVRATAVVTDDILLYDDESAY